MNGNQQPHQKNSARRKAKPVQRTQMRAGALSLALLLVITLALMTLCAMADHLEKKNGWRRDMSFNELTTQSETTLQVISELKYPVHIYALFSKGQEDQPLLELLARYAAASDMITWEQTDIGLNPLLLERYRTSSSEDVITNDSLLVTCDDTARFRVLGPQDFISYSYDMDQGMYTLGGLTYESSITSAIRYVTQESIPRAMILQGHGELDADSTAAFVSLVESNDIEVDYYNIRSQEVVLFPEDLLVILSPQKDLGDDELVIIQDFLSQGGSLLMTCDFTDPVEEMPNWQALMRYYGFLPKNGLVVGSDQEPYTFYDENRIYLLPTMQSTEITADLVAAGASSILLAGSRGFAMPEESDRDLSTSAVLTSGARAYLRVVTDNTTTLAQQEGDEMGPFALALQARRVTTDGYVSRAFICGCSTLLTSATIWSLTDAQELIVRVLEYLLNMEPVDLEIIPKVAVRPQLSPRSAALGTAIAVVLPVIVFAVAAVVLVKRKNM